VVMAHPTSVAHGLNLQSGGRAICWYTPTWNLEEYLQFVRRVYRQGQTRKVLNYQLIAEGTIDGFVYDTLLNKTKAQGNLLKHLRKYYAV
jgi:SNF2 family DNA or RNA helicase